MAGFRNVLVHAYDDVDLEIVYHALREGIDDLEAFGRIAVRRMTPTAPTDRKPPTGDSGP